MKFNNIIVTACKNGKDINTSEFGFKIHPEYLEDIKTLLENGYSTLIIENIPFLGVTTQGEFNINKKSMFTCRELYGGIVWNFIHYNNLLWDKRNPPKFHLKYIKDNIYELNPEPFYNK